MTSAAIPAVRPFAAAASPRRPRGRRSWTMHAAAVRLAFVGIVTSGVVFTIGGFNFAFERAFGLLLIAVLGWRLLTPTTPAIRRLLWIWAGWTAVLFGSALASGDFAAHLPPLLIAVIPIAYFALVAGRPLDAELVDRTVRALLWCLGVLGVLVEFAFRVRGSNAGLLDLIDPVGRLKLTVVEPNLLGSTIGFLMLLALPRARLTTATVVMYALALATFIGALSKSPYLAFALGVVFYGLFRAVAKRSNLSATIVLPLWAAALVGTLLLTVLPSVTDVYDKLLARQDAFYSRTYILRLAMNHFWTSPIIGRGPGDFGLQSASVLWAVGGQDDLSNLWIWQMMVNILHDSGVIGLTIYLLFLVMLINRGVKWVRAGSLDHCGYLAAFLSVLVSSQTSTVHLSAIFGLAAGLVAALPARTRAHAAPTRRDGRAMTGA